VGSYTLLQRSGISSHLNTIEVLHNNHERIRLNGIDSPEKGKAYGKRAKQAASTLVFGKEVTLRTWPFPS
jgi:endonuclease YncB( thermonuclease family)